VRCTSHHAWRVGEECTRGEGGRGGGCVSALAGSSQPRANSYSVPLFAIALLEPIRLPYPARRVRLRAPLRSEPRRDPQSGLSRPSHARFLRVSARTCARPLPLLPSSRRGPPSARGDLLVDERDEAGKPVDLLEARDDPFPDDPQDLIALRRVTSSPAPGRRDSGSERHRRGGQSASPPRVRG
jgi:hypothetical protein